VIGTETASSCEVELVIMVLFVTKTETASSCEVELVIMVLFVVGTETETETASSWFEGWEKVVTLVDLEIEVLFWNGSKGYWRLVVVLCGCDCDSEVALFGKKYSKIEENWEVEEGVVVEIVGEDEKAKKIVKAMKTSIKA